MLDYINWKSNHKLLQNNLIKGTIMVRYSCKNHLMFG